VCSLGFGLQSDCDLPLPIAAHDPETDGLADRVIIEPAQKPRDTVNGTAVNGEDDVARRDCAVGESADALQPRRGRG